MPQTVHLHYCPTSLEDPIFNQKLEDMADGLRKLKIVWFGFFLLHL